MFALEIQTGGQEASLLMRRPRVLLGPDERSHVTLPSSATEEIEIIRSLGRAFTVLRRAPDGIQKSDYEGSALLEFSGVSVRVVAIDLDLTPVADEPMDRAGIRLMRRAAQYPKIQSYPALMIRQEGTQAIMLSLPTAYPVVAGRGRACDVRLDAPDVSGTHVRILYEDGVFKAEDLGSTNGTFFGAQQIAGQTTLPSGADLRLGRSTLVRCLDAGAAAGSGVAELAGAVREGNGSVTRGGRGGAERTGGPAQQVSAQSSSIQSSAVSAVVASPFPCIVASSRSARPARISVARGSALTIGRDPSCDMWIGEPHISRRQCSLAWTSDGRIVVTDSSTNGTTVNGEVLRAGETRSFVASARGPVSVDLGGGVRVGLCFSEAHQREFELSRGVFGKRRIPTASSKINMLSTFSWAKPFVDGYLAAALGNNLLLRGLVWAATGVLLSVMIILGHLLLDSFR